MKNNLKNAEIVIPCSDFQYNRLIITPPFKAEEKRNINLVIVLLSN